MLIKNLISNQLTDRGTFLIIEFFATKNIYILGCITFTEVGLDEDCNEDCVKFDKIGLECKATIG